MSLTDRAPVAVDQRLPSRLHADWRELTRPTEPAGEFDPLMVEHLPVPARRWLRHAIAPGTRLRRRVLLRQHGEIRLGAWRGFTAVQALDPLEGFLWPVTTRVFGLPVTGFDRYSGGTGEMRHRLLGVVPVARASGPDIDRSAAARHTSEIIWAPAAALAHVAWYAADDRHVTLLVPCGGRMYRPTLTVADSGAVLRVSIPRWTDMGPEGWHEESFTALLGRERTFGGYTVPTRTTAGWGYGTARWEAGGAFIRQRIDSARYL